MSGSPNNGRTRKTNVQKDLQITSLTELLNDQDDGMRALFAKALNLYVAPGMDALEDSEKQDRLRKAIEDSITLT